MERRNHELRLGAIALALGVALAIGAAGQSAAADSSRIKSSLTTTGIDSDAEGRVKLRFKEKRSRLRIDVRDLDAHATYTLLVGGEAWASFETNRKGRGKVRFGSPARGKELPLPGDPRGDDLSIHDGSDDVLVAILSGDGESDDSRVREESFLTPTEFAVSGRARVRFERRKEGELRFDVDLENVPPSAYAVLVGGIERGVIATNSLGHGEREWRTDSDDPDHLPLDFDPRGEVVDIVNQANQIVFTGASESQLPGVNQCSFQELETPLTPSAAAGAGSGRARFRIRDDCRRDFNVEIEDVPLGAYELYVGGILRGPIEVIDLGTRNEGEIEFDTEVVDPGEIFLDFDPSGAVVDVRQGDTVFFTAIVGTPADPGTPGGGGDDGNGGDDGSGDDGNDDGGDPGDPPGGCGNPVEIEVPLVNSGLFPAGHAEARFRLRDECRTDFQVEIEDVPDGAYELYVGNELRGAISVSAGWGEIEFDDEPEGAELPIDFDPRGMEVRVEAAGSVAFERTFPN